MRAFSLDITRNRRELSSELQRLVDLDLDHPHIAQAVATGLEAGVAYLAQQYVTGESLDAAIRQYGPAPAADATRLMTHVAEALDAAARVGIFHGALHPRDLLVTPADTNLTGLGVSKALERIGQHGPIRRPYAAPERESGGEWGAAADVFSLAVVAYEVLTGHRPLPGTDEPMPGLSELRAADLAAIRELFETIHRSIAGPRWLLISRWRRSVGGFSGHAERRRPHGGPQAARASTRAKAARARRSASPV